MPHAISRLRSRKPGVEFVVEILTARDVAQRVASFKSELGLLIDAAAVSGILLEDLCTSRFGCVLPSGPALAQKPYLTIDDLSPQPIICLDRMLPLGALAHRILERADLQLRPAVEVSQSNIACVLVEAGAGIALIDKLGVLGRSGSDKLVSSRSSRRRRLSDGSRFPSERPRALLRKSSAQLREAVAELAATDSGFSTRALLA
ncbi:LysR substrate-binding domain-containing protein [Bosea lathyri]|uniref:LysR substrate-binding domain-containing protein n=1 Tax=Bosea lathyri TaxID=1036778 RepID=UPI001FCF2686|nr:LysR substrate-binding domain-containing protein [Bosea lathyri]